jgi:hypothetical protein
VEKAATEIHPPAPASGGEKGVKQKPLYLYTLSLITYHLSLITTEHFALCTTEHFALLQKNLPISKKKSLDLILFFNFVGKDFV